MITPSPDASAARLDATEPGKPPALSVATFAWGGGAMLPQAEALSLSLEKIRGKASAVTLSLPDTVAKISIMDFETLPQNADEEARLIGMKTAKGLFLKPEECVVSYHKLVPDKGARVAAVAAPRAFVEFFEDCLERAGMVVERVTLQSFDIFNVFTDRAGLSASYSLVIRRKGYFTFMAVRDNVLEFCRTKDVSGDEEYLGEVERSFSYYAAHSGEGAPDRLYSLDFAEKSILKAAVSNVEVEAISPASLLPSGVDTPPGMDVLSVVAAFGALKY